MSKNEKQLLEALEQLNIENKQILTSKEYQLGHRICVLIQDIRNLDLKSLIRRIIFMKRNRKEKERLYSHEPKKNVTEYTENIELKGKRIVIYTCITGNYDQIIEPLYVPENTDYMMYTNRENIKLSKWIIKKIPEKIRNLGNNVLINRYIKMHPQELFGQEYDYAIYIDGNIRIISNISSFISQIKANTGMAIHKHYVRDCIYYEAKACELYKKGNIKELKEQIEEYRAEGMPEKYGLLECNIIVSDLKNQNATMIFDEWWKEFIRTDSMRDQISLPYILWKFKYKLEDVGSLGENVRDNKKLQLMKHN